ncbi:MAG: chromosome segregation protein SMC, partial [Gammaproteobacteria bacterium]|nr:chromosome segregation protein SMC [Gammaproteobacteria bacterium]
GQEPRLAARLEVAAGWERAVETVLGDTLEAVCVTDLESPAQHLASLASGRLTLLESSPDAVADAPRTLGAQVRGPAAVTARLAAVRTVESLAAALKQRSALDAHSSFITPAGEWVGRDWLRISRGGAAHAGVLEREQQLKGLRGAAREAERAVERAEAALQGARTELEGAEARREGLQQEVQGAHAAHAAHLAALEARRGQLQQTQERQQRLTQDSGTIAAEEQRVSAALARSRTVLGEAQASLAALAAEQTRLGAERDERRAALAAARSAAQTVQSRSRELQVQVESRRSTVSSVQVAAQRMHEQQAQQLRRRGELEAELADGDAPILADQARLNDTLALRLTVEGELAAARAQLEEAEGALRTLDEERLGTEQRVQAAREAMDSARLSAQETHVRRAALAEQFAETRCELSALLAQLPAEADVGAHETQLGETRADVERLGQVNLAAIDELKDHTQRKEYLDSQFADLTAALGTLEEAMRRIDKETRTRFDDTFERINAGLREKFPRLFGGGHAYLELVGEDKLSAGVAVMARPPGKKNSTIHLLSGGEKALTAVALVFSIFDLNPAPFCLLDEVDAPLDEHNVGRFCDIVREMSSRVQFVFITHNKSTMELAAQLIGVTMNEPGVSRLVTVDVDEAVRLAAV